MEEERNEINWRIAEKDRKQISSMIKGVSRVNSMEDIAMTCANICGIQLAIVNISTTKPILYQFTWKLIKFIENKKTKIWMRNNSDSIPHLPMVFMANIHQVFQHLALFSQNLINTNKIEVINDKFDTKKVITAIKLASKFINKMQEHINDDSIPKGIPEFAKSFSAEATEGGFAFVLKSNDAKKPNTTQLAKGMGGKHKPNDNEQP